MAGGGIEILARSTSPLVGSMSIRGLLRLEGGAFGRSCIEERERTDEPEVVRERASRDVAIVELALEEEKVHKCLTCGKRK